MIKSIIALFIIICALPQLGSAQINLVYNGGFEDISKCPDSRNEIKYAHYWTPLDTIWDPDTSVTLPAPWDNPDLFTSCGSYPFGSLPVNASFYYHLARSGGSMVQIINYNNCTDASLLIWQRDYLQGRLCKKLIYGKSYCVTFYVSANQISRYANNMMGAFLDDGTIDTVSSIRSGLIQNVYVPQVFDTSIISDTLHWTKIQGTFISNGREKFITIGNFFDNAHTDTIGMYVPTMYYTAGGGDRFFGSCLIDDVSVIATDAVANAGNDTFITMAIGDSAWVGNHDSYVPCKWYTISGTLIDSNVGGFKVKPGVTTRYIMELDVCGHITRDTVTVFVKPSAVATSPFPSKGGVTCYPNSARDEVTIEVASAKSLTMTDFDVVFYDVVGRAVLHTTLVQQRQVIDVSKLAQGLYTVQLMHTVTGEKSTLKFVVE